MNLDQLVAELNQRLDVVEAELWQDDVPAWDGAMSLPELCTRGHPWAVYGRRLDDGNRECRRCRRLLEDVRTLAHDTDVVPPLRLVWSSAA